jgi:hypothetical protein
MELDPKFKKWLDTRRVAQGKSPGIPTRGANPTRTAGPKNSNGPKRGSSKSSVSVPDNSVTRKKSTIKDTKGTSSSVKRTGVDKPKTSKSVGRPKGKVRATNNPRLSSRIG